jgi:Lhr-like helicase
MMTNRMTVEQLDAVEDFLAGDNVTISANYGSGKTRSCMPTMK